MSCPLIKHSLIRLPENGQNHLIQGIVHKNWIISYYSIGTAKNLQYSPSCPSSSIDFPFTMTTSEDFTSTCRFSTATTR